MHTTSQPLCPPPDQHNNTSSPNVDNYHKDRRKFHFQPPLRPTSIIICMFYFDTGNVLVLVAVAKFLQKISVLNVFVASLSCADLLVVVVNIPIKVSIPRHYLNFHVPREQCCVSSSDPDTAPSPCSGLLLDITNGQNIYNMQSPISVIIQLSQSISLHVFPSTD